MLVNKCLLCIFQISTYVIYKTVSLVQRGVALKMNQFYLCEYRREKYSNGENIPIFRGCIHACVTVILILSLFSMGIVVLYGVVPFCYWKMLFLLSGKLASYYSSAIYHLHPQLNVDDESRLLKNDLLMIVVSIWASSSVFIDSNLQWIFLFVIMVVVVFVSSKLIALEFENTNSDWHFIRLLLYFSYFIFNILVVGDSYGFTLLWYAGSLLYIASFCICPHVSRTFAPVLWHKVDRNGWHEDFHFILLTADLTYLIMASQYAISCS